MIYSKYFGAITNENGQPNLNNDQFRRMMNIISAEGVVHGLRFIKEKYKNTPGYYKYDVIIFKHQLVLTNLTGNLKPEDLLKEMYRFSKD